MVSLLPVKKGISNPTVPNVPTEWNAEWFRRFISSYLHTMDPRNAVSPSSVTVSGNPVSQPTIQVHSTDASLAVTSTGVAVKPHLGLTTDASGLSAGQIDPSTTPSTVVQPGQGILAKGNVMPMVQNSAFTYTSDTADITFSWTAYTVYRPDGTSFAVTAGSQLISGLSSATTYNAYVYSTEAAPGTIVFVSGLSGQVGTPAVAFPPSATYAQTSAALAAASVLGNIFQGKLTGATTASGGGGGGGGGGGYGCPHPEQRMMTQDGFCQAKELKPGDLIFTPTGWSVIVDIHSPDSSEWIEVLSETYANITEKSLVTPDHRFVTPDGSLVKAKDLKLGQMLAGEKSYHRVLSLQLVEDHEKAIGLEFKEPHLYYFTDRSPLSHNLKP